MDITTTTLVLLLVIYIAVGLWMHHYNLRMDSPHDPIYTMVKKPREAFAKSIVLPLECVVNRVMGVKV